MSQQRGERGRGTGAGHRGGFAERDRREDPSRQCSKHYKLNVAGSLARFLVPLELATAKSWIKRLIDEALPTLGAFSLDVRESKSDNGNFVMVLRLTHEAPATECNGRCTQMLTDLEGTKIPFLFAAHLPDNRGKSVTVALPTSNSDNPFVRFLLNVSRYCDPGSRDRDGRDVLLRALEDITPRQFRRPLLDLAPGRCGQTFKQFAAMYETDLGSVQRDLAKVGADCSGRDLVDVVEEVIAQSKRSLQQRLVGANPAVGKVPPKDDRELSWHELLASLFFTEYIHHGSGGPENLGLSEDTELRGVLSPHAFRIYEPFVVVPIDRFELLQGSRNEKKDAPPTRLTARFKVKLPSGECKTWEFSPLQCIERHIRSGLIWQSGLQGPLRDKFHRRYSELPDALFVEVARRFLLRGLSYWSPSTPDFQVLVHLALRGQRLMRDTIAGLSPVTRDLICTSLKLTNSPDALFEFVWKAVQEKEPLSFLHLCSNLDEVRNRVKDGGAQLLGMQNDASQVEAAVNLAVKLAPYTAFLCPRCDTTSLGDRKVKKQAADELVCKCATKEEHATPVLRLFADLKSRHFHFAGATATVEYIPHRHRPENAVRKTAKTKDHNHLVETEFQNLLHLRPHVSTDYIPAPYLEPGLPNKVRYTADGLAYFDMIHARPAATVETFSKDYTRKAFFEFASIAAKSLTFLHKAGWAHNDIKPGAVAIHGSLLELSSSSPVTKGPEQGGTSFYYPDPRGGSPQQRFADDIRALGLVLMHFLQGGTTDLTPPPFTAKVFRYWNGVKTSLKDFLLAMIHPDCTMRPTALDCHLFFFTTKEEKDAEATSMQHDGKKRYIFVEGPSDAAFVQFMARLGGLEQPLLDCLCIADFAAVREKLLPPSGSPGSLFMAIGTRDRDGLAGLVRKLTELGLTNGNDGGLPESKLYLYVWGKAPSVENFFVPITKAGSRTPPPPGHSVLQELLGEHHLPGADHEEPECFGCSDSQPGDDETSDGDALSEAEAPAHDVGAGAGTGVDPNDAEVTATEWKDHYLRMNVSAALREEDGKVYVRDPEAMWGALQRHPRSHRWVQEVQEEAQALVQRLRQLFFPSPPQE